MDVSELTINGVQEGLRGKQFSCLELTKNILAHIETVDTAFGAYLRPREEALAEAQVVDDRLAAGEEIRPLEGVPLAVKDNIMIKGETVTAGSKILGPYQGVFTATAVQRLQAAGAIVVGKTNLDEFGMGASTENSAYQPTRNPWNVALVPGGSSGGSAVAVAAGQAVVAIGSDTGGSIRQPASFCNVVGMKPTYGRVSRYGLIALASSLDTIGPLARTVEDAAAVYQAMAGSDANDATTNPGSVDDATAAMRQPIDDLRIGIPKEFFGEGVDPQVAKVIMEAVKVYEKMGAQLIDVSLPHTRHSLATYYIILPAEASSNLARYDGIRYGLSAQDGASLMDVYTHTRAHGFGPEVKRRIMLGTFGLSAGYADAYYHQAQRVREVIREEFHQIFDQVDVLLAPTSPTVAFPLGARTQDPLTMYLADLLTVPVNIAGIPAISVPAGFVNDLPVGLQLMAKRWDEATLFRAAAAFQGATDWHTRRPPIAAEA